MYVVFLCIDYVNMPHETQMHSFMYLFSFVSTALTLNVLQFYRFALTTLTCKLNVNFWQESPSIEFHYTGLINADMGLTCYPA